MKKIISSNHITYAPLLLTFLMAPCLLSGQNDTTQAKEKQQTSIAPSVIFTSIQKSDSTIELRAAYKAKINGTQSRLSGLHITFSIKTDSAEKQIGEGLTGITGIAVFTCKPGMIKPDLEGKLHFKASFAGNKTIEASEDELTIKKALLVITPVKEDSVMSVQLKLVDLSTGNEKPVSGAGLNVYVKRLFNPLKLGESKTDTAGQASVDIPANLPGDSKGNIILLARLEDNDEYGNLEAAVTQTWGKPVSDEIKELPRALWSTHPPLWMLITFIILVTVVWGHYIIIIYELFRLRKEHV